MPLDSTHLIFSSSYGKFYGNSLWIDRDCKEEKITIKIVMKNNKALYKDFVMYIKKKEDNERLKTSEEILQEMKEAARKKKKN